mmetsp:Transcript_17395/g.32602  ORF Transcript_17395/g.32602 Transcript_17395/m.32602 type:complete len:152 (-) Transcript_17395:221-676(-)
MLRSAQSVLKQATRVSSPRTPSIISSTASSHALPTSSSNHLVITSRTSFSTNGTSSSSDYDQIMHSSSLSPSLRPATTTAMSQLPLGIGAMAPTTSSDVISKNTSNCYRSVDEPTECEDYDGDTLHHPPCERTHESSYFDDSYESCHMVGW